MSDEQKDSSPRYKVRLIGIRGEEFEDVIYCACIKAPFIKKASFWNIKINVSALWASQLFNDLGAQVKPTVYLQIREIMHEGSHKSIEDEGKLIHSKKYMCLSATSKDISLNAMSDQNLVVNMFLVDHVLYDMSISNAFNRKLSNVTAFEALQEFEKSLKTNYGDQTFYNNYIGIEDGEKSDYKYEEILITTMNDLQVTDMLIYSKKILRNLSFYFHDDFYLDSNNLNNITNHFINLSDISKLTPFDISKYFDTLYSNMIISETPLADTFRKFTDGFDSFIFKTKYMFDKLIPEDIKTLFSPETTNITQTDYEINEQRKAKVNTAETNFVKSSVPKKSKQVFVPDKKDLAKERLKNYHEFIDSKVKNLKIVQTADCYADWLQFGRAYNLDLTQPEKYLYTPIMIGNIFYRDGGIERTTKHIAKSVMLEYYSNDKTCSSCKFYQVQTCTLHYIKKYENSYCYDHTE